MSAELLEVTADGLYCPAADSHIDPWRPVPRAIVTHAHSDHATPGCGSYLAAAPGAGVLRLRMGDQAVIQALPYGQAVTIGTAAISLHPAGHLLGSAQVRIAAQGQTWVVSGDYKVDPDPTCAPFEPVPCGVFVSESTFALPIYRWRASSEIADEINAWWRANQGEGRTSVVFAYALGKAQRVLSMLDRSIGPILVHGSVRRMLGAYAAAGIALPPVIGTWDAGAATIAGNGIVIAPPSAGGTTWLRRFGACSTALASGWMQVRGARRRRNLDRGFVLSDHADWRGLNQAIDATGAERVLVTHGQVPTLCRWLNERGLSAEPLLARYAGELASETHGGVDDEAA